MIQLLRKTWWLLILFGFVSLFSFPVQGHTALTQIAGCTFDPEAGGDLADLRGIRFTLSEDFQALELFMGASGPGVYVFTAEIRRSSGFDGEPLRQVRVSADLPKSPTKTLVHIDFSEVEVSLEQTFTLRFVQFSGPGRAYFAVKPQEPDLCPNVEETESNTGNDLQVRANEPWLRVLGPGQASELSMSSTYVDEPPDIDGSIGFGEWPMGNSLALGNGYIKVANDLHRLYVLVNILEDSTKDSDDYFWLTFDVNRDGEITSYTDIQYSTNPTTGEMRYQYFEGPGAWTGLQPETYSSMGEGFGCFFADGTLFVRLNPYQITCNSHRVWELGIDLAEIGARAGGMARMGLRIGTVSSGFNESIPEDFTTNFSNLIEVDLASYPSFIIYPSPAQTLELDQGPDRDAVEINQAIQDRANTLPLVQEKKSVARVYSTSSYSLQPGIVFLYGSKGGIDLPGSPLAVFHNSPVSIDREDRNDTANFQLPKTWTQGNVSFRAVVRDLFKRTKESSDIPLTFSETETPEYWVIPLNSGTAAAPNLPDEEDVDAQESLTESIYPVPKINFKRKSWEVIGPTTINNAIDDLNYYYACLVLGWIFSGFSFDLPDQVYGILSSGGGTSDPGWCGGLGYVARGGVSDECVMAHEIIHNLGPGDCAVYPDSDLWGRHVSNRISGMDNGYCIPGDTTYYGCGATGADAGWQARYDDGEIHEVGVDTSVQPFRVVPADKPEVMSYCEDTELPTAWISDYRWVRMFGYFLEPAKAELDAKSADILALEVQPTIYLSGQVYLKGGGKLAPAMVQEGIPMTQDEVTPGRYAIELWPEKGDKPLYRLTFKATFSGDIARDIPDPRYSAPFNLRLPALRGVAQIRLTQEKVSQPLDIIDVDFSAPEVEVVSPQKGETWRDKGTIKWTALDRDSEQLTFTILYSQDKGQSWKPLSGQLGPESKRQEYYTYEVDPKTIPAGPDRVDPTSLVRVIATDGYNTSRDDSDLFFVTPNPPQVSISSPKDGSTFNPGEMISFQGRAQDEEDEDIPEEKMVWTYDGNPFGTGSELQAVLPEGTHEVALTAVDSDGQQGSASLSITVIPYCEGDFDNDGDVDGLDLSVFSADFGRTDCCGPNAETCEGDFDQDCDVDGLDLSVFAADFGRTDCP